MGKLVKAIYKDGKLILQAPVDLQEGQEVWVTIMNEHEYLKFVLGDLVVDTSNMYQDDEDFDEEELMREIEEGTKGITLSDIIIQERNEGM